MSPLSARNLARLCLVTGAFVAWSVVAHGIERKPLPTFTLTTLDDQRVSSQTLVRTGNWLLVTVRPACAPCDTLLRTIDPATAMPAHTAVVIVGVDVATAARLANGFSDVAGITWYVDPGGAMKDVLHVAAAPVVFGMRESAIEWSLAGIVPDAASMRTALMSWIGR